MQGINDVHLGSSVREKIAGKLPEDSKKHAFSKGDACYWGGPGRLFKDHGVADYGRANFFL
jgi:hypothetical protein